MVRKNISEEELYKRWKLLASLPPDTRPLQSILMFWNHSVLKGTFEAIDHSLTEAEQEILGGKEKIADMLRTPCPIGLVKEGFSPLYDMKSLMEAKVQFKEYPY